MQESEANFRKLKITEECPICIHLMTIGDLQYLMNCIHLFHSKCIETSQQNDERCLWCSIEMTLDDLTTYVRRKNAITHKEDRRRIVACRMFK